jgi:hypothetical protein
VSGVTAGRHHRSAPVVERIGWFPFACLIGAVLLVSSAALVWNASPYWGRNGHQVSAARVGSVPANHAGGAGQALQLWPNRIHIPKLDATAPIEKVGTTSTGELDIPLNPKIVGWWSPGARPGARKGTAVIAGHINYAGVTGTLSAIGTLRPGDRVMVYGHRDGATRKLTYRVTGVRTYHKTNLPYRQIFDQHVAGRLALVTCGGPFDAATGNYLDNIVAYAVPARAHTRPLLP